jgi:hypothetical protein
VQVIVRAFTEKDSKFVVRCLSLSLKVNLYSPSLSTQGSPSKSSCHWSVCSSRSRVSEPEESGRGSFRPSLEPPPITLSRRGILLTFDFYLSLYPLTKVLKSSPYMSHSYVTKELCSKYAWPDRI